MAKRFVFSLEIVRKLRDQSRRVQQRTLAEAQRDVNDVQARLADNERQVSVSMEEERTASSQPGLDVSAVRRQLLHRGWLKRKETELMKEWNDRRLIVIREREKLAEAIKRLKVIEKLRERRWAQHVEQEHRVERKAADETASQRFVAHQEREFQQA
ncbi:MAG: flagellar FliJ family protein [Planctomycetota bacterium]